MADNDIFNHEAYLLLQEHVDEFEISSAGVVAHLYPGCGWTHPANTWSPWGLRALALGHMRRNHPEFVAALSPTKKKSNRGE